MSSYHSYSKYRDPHFIQELKKEIAETKRSNSVLGFFDKNKDAKKAERIQELEKLLEVELEKPAAINEVNSTQEATSSNKASIAAENVFLACSLYAGQVKKV